MELPYFSKILLFHKPSPVVESFAFYMGEERFLGE